MEIDPRAPAPRGVAALACLLQNVATIFPEDPTQKSTP